MGAVDGHEVVADEPSHRRPLGALLAGATGVALGVAAVQIPREDSPLPAVARYATQIALPQWHTTEAVNEVVYGTRGFDTFGETFLLLAAVVSVSVVSRRKERRLGFIGEELAGDKEQAEIGEADRGPQSRGEGEARAAEREEQGRRRVPATPDAVPIGTPGPEVALGMSIVVRTAIRIVIPLVLVAGAYLVAWGYSPGGGFPGGAVMLGGVLLAYVGYGYPKVRRVVRPDIVEPLELGGAMIIIAIELLGLLLKGSFSANFLPLGSVQTIRSGGILQAFSASELVEVGTGLTLAVFGLLGMGHDWNDDDEEDEDDDSNSGSGSAS